jgi:hypothetical protein
MDLTGGRRRGKHRGEGARHGLLGIGDDDPLGWARGEAQVFRLEEHCSGTRGRKAAT